MDKFQISILEYLGRIGEGIMVLISVVFEGEYYEATYFYTSNKMIFTVSDLLESKIGHKITEDESYKDIMEFITRKIVPYDEMYNKLDDVNFRRWVVEEESN